MSLLFKLNVFLQYLQRCVLRFASFLFCFFLSLFSFDVSLFFACDNCDVLGNGSSFVSSKQLPSWNGFSFSKNTFVDNK